MMNGQTKHQDAEARARRRKFRIDGLRAHKNLERALLALEENEEPLTLALGCLRGADQERSLKDVCSALRILVEGEA